MPSVDAARRFPADSPFGVSLPPAACFDTQAAARAWTQFAAFHGADTRVKAAARDRDGTWTYPAWRTRDYTPALPDGPTAVLLYDPAGYLSVAAFDFDAKTRSARPAVERDAATLYGWLTDAGLHPVMDQSVTGGIHVYARLPARVHHRDVQPVLDRVNAVLPTLDPTPLRNRAQGCLRPPGSPHTKGGYQTLRGPWDAAVTAWTTTPSPDAWSQFHSLIPSPAPTPPSPLAAMVVRQPARTTARRPISPTADALARDHATSRVFTSNSERRFSIALSAVCAGWDYNTYAAHIHDPANGWNWLRESYATRRPGLLAWDWDHAVSARKDHTRRRTIRIPYTSPPLTHRAPTTSPPDDVHLALRKFRTFTTDYVRDHGYPPRRRAALRALIWAGHVQGRALVNVGLRSLGEQAGMSHTAVNGHLPALAEAGLITKVADASGSTADVWRLNVDLAENCRPATGRAHAMRPVFRRVGGFRAAEVYETLIAAQKRGDTLTSADLSKVLGYDVRRIYETLKELAAWDLAVQDRGRWSVGPADPDEVAETTGGLDELRAQHAEHVRQRQQWDAYLNGPKKKPMTGQSPLPLTWEDEFALVSPDPDAWIAEHAHPPPAQRSAYRNNLVHTRTRDPQQAVALVRDVLGGVVVAS